MSVKKVKQSFGDRVYDAIVHFLLIIISIIMIYPILNVVSIAVSPFKYYAKHPMMFFPTQFDFSAFKFVFTNNFIFSGYKNTLFITITGTVIGLFLTSITAYSLSRKELKGKKFLMTYFIVVMIFSGGLIPSFLVTKGLGLYESLWALIMPFIMPIYHLIITKTFFESIPESLIEAAKIDGAHEWYIYSKVVLPLSKPVLAAIVLFQAIIYWNDYFNAIIYLNDQKDWPLQLILREIITAVDARFMNANGNMAEIDPSTIPAKSVQYAALIVVILPIMCVYPFIQKYFVKGVMIGAVKG